jgi:L-rhamnose mutarotase
VCRRWWAFMRDVMETNPDDSPMSEDLAEVFHLSA